MERSNYQSSAMLDSVNARQQQLYESIPQFPPTYSSERRAALILAKEARTAGMLRDEPASTNRLSIFTWYKGFVVEDSVREI